MTQYIINGTFINDILQVINKATHPQFPHELVEKAKHGLTQLPVYKEEVKEEPKPANKDKK